MRNIMDIKEKLNLYNKSKVNVVNEHISWIDGKFVAQFQVGHPGEEDSIKGCFSSHFWQATRERYLVYSQIVPSAQNDAIISKIDDIIRLDSARSNDRKERGVQFTDKL